MFMFVCSELKIVDLFDGAEKIGTSGMFLEYIMVSNMAFFALNASFSWI